MSRHVLYFLQDVFLLYLNDVMRAFLKNKRVSHVGLVYNGHCFKLILSINKCLHNPAVVAKQSSVCQIEVDIL